MNVRTYCRRSKNDEGKQQFSLDVQSAGCSEMIARMGFAAESRTDYVDDGLGGDDFLTRAGLRGCSPTPNVATSSSAAISLGSVAMRSR